jgi:hypothetical protein
MAYIGKQPVIGNFVKLDAISVVNGQAAYTMNNGGSAFTNYDNVNQFLVSLNGILQAPTDSFTVSGSTLTFASNLATGDVIDFVIVLGNTLDIGTPSDNTVSLAKLTATGTKDATTFLRGDNTFAVAGGTNTPSFFATNGSAQTIPNATLTKIEYPTEVFDTDSAYDATNDKFVVPSGKGGKYFFHAAFKMGIDNDFNELRCVIYKNGSALYNTNTSHFHFESGMVTAVLDLSATDYVEIYGYQSKGTGENTIADSNSNYFMGFKLI